jgi:hypothetical protein
VLKTIRVTHDSMRLLLDKPRPRIAVAAIESALRRERMFGSEDDRLSGRL